jgi:hypothetical protein
MPTFAHVLRVLVSAVLFFVLLLLPSVFRLRKTDCKFLVVTSFLNDYFLRRSTIR